MKFSDAEVNTLVELSRTTTGCASPECVRLEVYGLVVTGRSRFGVWAKATDAGRQYVGRMPARGSRATPTRGTGETVQSDVHGSDAVPTSVSQALVGPPNGDLPPGTSQGKPSRPAAKGVSAPKAATQAQGTSSSAAMAQALPRPKSPRRRACSTPVSRREAIGESVTPSTLSSSTPNAVRVIANGRVTYFPLSAYEALNGTKQRVHTTNRLFRSTPMATSGADKDVVCE